MADSEDQWVATLTVDHGEHFAVGTALADRSQPFAAVAPDGRAATLMPTGRMVESPGEVSAADVAQYLEHSRFEDSMVFRRGADPRTTIEVTVDRDQADQLARQLQNTPWTDRWGRPTEPPRLDLTPGDEYQRPRDATPVLGDSLAAAEAVIAAADRSLTARARDVTEDADQPTDRITEDSAPAMVPETRGEVLR